MLGRTHFFVGTAVSLAVLHPQSMSSLVAGAGAAAIGSMISDVDSGTSQAHQEADKIMAAVIAVSAVVIILDYKFHVGIYTRLMRDCSIARLLTGVLGLLVICLYGRDTPHRSFMHSFLGAVMLTGCVDVIYPDAAPYFAVGFLSHLALDLLNRRSVKLFWPWKKGYCMGICSSRGWINHLCMLAGMGILALDLILSAPAARLAGRILKWIS